MIEIIVLSVIRIWDRHFSIFPIIARISVFATIATRTTVALLETMEQVLSSVTPLTSARCSSILQIQTQSIRFLS